MDINGWFCMAVLERFIYRYNEPPPRQRTKPLEVLCVGFPRTGTESLQQALMALGYDYTFHGWDITFERPHYMPSWVRLGRRKFFATASRPYKPITAAEFDKLIGHSVAVTDACGSCFATDLIHAYPTAKVILNTRNDIDAWQTSVNQNLGAINENWVLYVLSWLDNDLFWMWHVYERALWAGLFQCHDGKLRGAIEGKGKLLYEEHNDMVRGLMKRLGREDELLEWNVQDGWKPLCKFLGKEIPKQEFPRANDRNAFKKKEEQLMKEVMSRVTRKLVVLSSILLVTGLAIWKMK